jgi:hypothetical protein
VNLQGQFSTWELDCADVPPHDGETPVGTVFMHEVCRGENAALGQRLTIVSRFLRRPGQTGIDPHTRQYVEGAFESDTRLELVQEPYEPTTSDDA